MGSGPINNTDHDLILYFGGILAPTEEAKELKEMGINSYPINLIGMVGNFVINRPVRFSSLTVAPGESTLRRVTVGTDAEGSDILHIDDYKLVFMLLEHPSKIDFGNDDWKFSDLKPVGTQPISDNPNDDFSDHSFIIDETNNKTQIFGVLIKKGKPKIHVQQSITTSSTENDEIQADENERVAFHTLVTNIGEIKSKDTSLRLDFKDDASKSSYNLNGISVDENSIVVKDANGNIVDNNSIISYEKDLSTGRITALNLNLGKDANLQNGGSMAPQSSGEASSLYTISYEGVVKSNYESLNTNHIITAADTVSYKSTTEQFYSYGSPIRINILQRALNIEVFQDENADGINNNLEQYINNQNLEIRLIPKDTPQSNYGDNSLAINGASGIPLYYKYGDNTFYMSDNTLKLSGIPIGEYMLVIDIPDSSQYASSSHYLSSTKYAGSGDLKQNAAKNSDQIYNGERPKHIAIPISIAGDVDIQDVGVGLVTNTKLKFDNQIPRYVSDTYPSFEFSIVEGPGQDFGAKLDSSEIFKLNTDKNITYQSDSYFTVGKKYILNEKFTDEEKLLFSFDNISFYNSSNSDITTPENVFKNNDNSWSFLPVESLISGKVVLSNTSKTVILASDNIDFGKHYISDQMNVSWESVDGTKADDVPNGNVPVAYYKIGTEPGKKITAVRLSASPTHREDDTSVVLNDTIYWLNINKTTNNSVEIPLEGSGAKLINAPNGIPVNTEDTISLIDNDQLSHGLIFKTNASHYSLLSEGKYCSTLTWSLESTPKP